MNNLDETQPDNSKEPQEELPQAEDNEVGEISSAPIAESSEAESETPAKKRTRVNRPYPIQSFEEALKLASAIQQHTAGKQVRRLILFEILGKSPESSTSRQWVTSASGYGLIKGSAASDYLELTEEGRIAAGEGFSDYEQTKIRANLAILHIPAFKAFYDEFAGNKLPVKQFLRDFAKTIVADNLADEALDLFIVNAKFVGLLRVIAGTERLIKIEHLLELISNENPQNNVETGTNSDEYDEIPPSTPNITSTKSNGTTLQKSPLDEVCFYISPIGEPSSEIRQHADLFLNYLIQPALEGTGLKVVRADKIDRGGIITSQIIRHLLKSKLVIADLSFNNANVFYELAIRHATRLPTVQIIRSSDSIPFDLNQIRTIRIDSRSIYTLIPQLDTYISEIATQVRGALEGAEDSDNPISIFYPSFKVSID